MINSGGGSPIVAATFDTLTVCRGCGTTLSSTSSQILGGIVTLKMKSLIGDRSLKERRHHSTRALRKTPKRKMKTVENVLRELFSLPPDVDQELMDHLFDFEPTIDDSIVPFDSDLVDDADDTDDEELDDIADIFGSAGDDTDGQDDLDQTEDFETTVYDEDQDDDFDDLDDGSELDDGFDDDASDFSDSEW